MQTRFTLSPAQKRGVEMLGGDQRHSMLVGGARSGKTFLIVRSVVVRALRGEMSRHAMLRFRGNAAWRSLALDTLPAVMRKCFPGVGLSAHRQDGYFALPNKSEIWIGGLDDKERVEKILGQEYATIYFNECSQIPYGSVLAGLTRLAQQIPGLMQRAYYDLNPVGRGHWSNRLFGDHRDPVSQQPLVDAKNYDRMFMNPEDNADNLAPEYLASLRALPERQRRRFYEGVYVDEAEGALWSYEIIERCRAPQPENANLRRVVVAVDASGASGREDLAADEIGIVVAALGQDGHGYVLADRSCRESPSIWGRRVSEAADEFGADCIVAEKNFGGEMVRFVIKSANPRLMVRMVTASRGKVVRAEPVSALYGDATTPSRVHHCQRFPVLEDQLCGFTTTGYVGNDSPDHADALVWALTELMLSGNQGIVCAPYVGYAPVNIPGENVNG
jgi:phage terminase large subunit-like protein